MQTFSVVLQITEEAPPEPVKEKNPAAVALGKLGGRQGSSCVYDAREALGIA